MEYIKYRFYQKANKCAKEFQRLKKEHADVGDLDDCCDVDAFLNEQWYLCLRGRFFKREFTHRDALLSFGPVL